ncbi:MAG: hypothetical protein ACXWD7_00395 [Solirubrobacterales bacterium]
MPLTNDLAQPRSGARRPAAVLLALAAAAALLVFPGRAFAGAVITPVPTFPYPSVTVGEQFPASVTLFNNSTGAEAAIGVTVGASNLDFYPACPSVVTTSDCPAPEDNIFTLSSTGSSGSGACPPGTWAIAESAPGRFRFTPPAPIQLPAFGHCTIEFTAIAVAMPVADASPIAPGVQTNQIASVDTYSPVSGITVRNSGSGATTVIAAPVGGGPSNPKSGPSARLKVSEGCKRIAKATVTGEQIRQVTFLVDNRRYSVDNAAPFTATIPTGRMAAGRHRLRADVTFAQGTGRLNSSVKGGFLRCRKRTVKYTG